MVNVSILMEARGYRSIHGTWKHAKDRYLSIAQIGVNNFRGSLEHRPGIENAMGP